MAKDDRVYGFSKPDAESLLQGLDGGSKHPGQSPRPSMDDYRPIIRTPAGGIPKRVGNTVTMVECDCYYLAGTGSTRTVTATGSKVWVGNYSTTEDIAGNRDILPTWHGGALLANWEDC